MKILVTGSSGFVGKNFIANLRRFPEHEVLTFDIQNSQTELINALEVADIVFHLAGVNRPQNAEEFKTGNADLTLQITQILQSNGKQTPLVLSSSTQAEFNNPYGESKRAAEDVVFEYSRETNAQTYVFRLPNVFGKWAKPNYNSAVATFCYNTANNLPITINDPNSPLKLIYIDDVVDMFLAILADEFSKPAIGAFAQITNAVDTTVGEVAEIVQSFPERRASLLVPSERNKLEKSLYATYLSYLPASELSYPLDMKSDERGWFAEFIHTPENGQVAISTTKPGISRGNHWHNTKIEKFIVVKGTGKILIRKVTDENRDEIIEFNVTGNKAEVVEMPPGFIHSIINDGDDEMILVIWGSELFNPDKPDTYWEEV